MEVHCYDCNSFLFDDEGLRRADPYSESHLIATPWPH